MSPPSLSFTYLPFLALSADKATDVGIHEGEGLCQQGTHVGDPHDKDGHTECGVDHGHYPTPLCLGGDVPIS